MLFGNGFPERFDLAHVADMAGECLGAAARVTNGCRHGFAAIDLAAGDHDMGARPGQGSGNGFTNAAAGAGDDGHAAGKVEQFVGTHGVSYR